MAVAQTWAERTACQDLRVEVRWAFTGELLAIVNATTTLSVATLKGMLGKAAKTPSRYLKLIMDETALEDSQVLADAGITTNIVLKVAREACPDTLILDLLRSKFKACHADMPMNAHWITTQQPESVEDLELVRYALDSNSIGVNSKEDFGSWSWDPSMREEDEKAYQRLTALHFAALMGLKGICGLLLDSPNFTQVDATCRVMCTRIGSPYDFEFNLISEDDCTALHCATIKGHLEVCSLLLQHSRFTVVSATAAGGWTALHYAALFPHKKLVALLLQDQRFDVDATNKWGASPIDVAKAEMQADYWFSVGVERDYAEVCQLMGHFSKNQVQAVLEAQCVLEDNLQPEHADLRYDATRQNKCKGVGAKFKQTKSRKSHSAPTEEHRRNCKANTKAKAGLQLLAHALSGSLD